VLGLRQQFPENIQLTWKLSYVKEEEEEEKINCASFLHFQPFLLATNITHSLGI